MKKMRLLIIISVLLLVGCEKEEQVDEIETETDVIEYKIIFPSTDWQRIVTVFPELKNVTHPLNRTPKARTF